MSKLINAIDIDNNIILCFSMNQNDLEENSLKISINFPSKYHNEHGINSLAYLLYAVNTGKITEMCKHAISDLGKDNIECEKACNEVLMRITTEENLNNNINNLSLAVVPPRAVLHT